jgi:adenosine deaminase
MTAVIVCGLRNLPVATSIAMAELAVAFRDRGVVAFDLAGAEHGHPPIEHKPAFHVAADANMAITIHAGEAFGPASIHQAIHACNARRIGHGTRLFEDADLTQYVNDFRVPLEICLTSNVQTRAAPSGWRTPAAALLRPRHRALAEHRQPAHERHDADGRVPARAPLPRLRLGRLCELTLMAFESAFLPWQEKVALVAAVRQEMGSLVGAA